jgi:TetR/AcrR family transcriptional repressor of mexCD-oprJ operon
MKSTHGRRPRSDATRNREAILQATLSTLNESPRASMGEIAVAAGVSRGTLYSHFPSRHALVRAALHLVVSEANMTLKGLDDPALSPGDAVAALVATSWRVLSHMASLWAAAGCELGPWELRRLHQDTMSRISKLVMHGRRDGTFRTDQNVQWQMECIYAIARAGASLSRPEDPAPIDPTDAIVATVRTVLAAAPAASE